MSNEFLWPDEPSVLQGKDLDKVLLHTTPLGTSDVTIQTNCEVLAEIHGKLRKVTRHKLSYGEVLDLLAYVTKSDGAFTRITSAEDLDLSYDIKPDRNTRYRYRVNATGVQTEGQLGVQITMRTIPNLPPSLASMKLPQAILDNRAPKQGLVLVTGATGSGKSTLLASIIRDLLEDPHSHRKILTYEQPIEFVYDEVNTVSASIAQTEIPTMLPSFKHGLRNALRRKPAVILVGEMRDTETISEGITASMTGHAVYSTVHTNGVADSVRRMVNTFSKEEQHSRGVDIVSSLKMVVSQMLLPSVDGKRVAIREFLVMNDTMANEMMENIDNLALCTRKLLKANGQTFLQDATEKYQAGLIDKQQWHYIKALSDGQDADLMRKG
jgi:defect-in-organelle-trafficking protein DotB